MSNKFLIAGLGNIGVAYAHTRHNIGFDVADALAKKHEVVFTTQRLAALATIKLKGRQVFCIKPTTYMNLSGKAVKYWIAKEKIPLENILVIVDELALPLNKLRIRSAGSAAGHNGLKSIEEALQTDKYGRLRFGIGNEFVKGQQVDFVLGRWSEAEQPLVSKKIAICVEAINDMVTMGIERTMNTYNKLVFTL
jgi:peptidyl-tRNA hydrolase, PTH1 family